MADREEFSLAEYDETIRAVLDSGGEFVIYPKGTSMLPLIRQGRDCVTLAKPSAPLKKGDIAFYLRDNGQYVLHRVVGVDNGRYTMCGDNQTAPEKGIDPRQIIGLVIKISVDGKQVQDKFSYKLYKLLWSSFFIRKVLLKFGRIFSQKHFKSGDQTNGSH